MKKSEIWMACREFKYIENKIVTKKYRFRKDSSYLMITASVVGEIIINRNLYSEFLIGDVLCHIVYLGQMYEVRSEYYGKIIYSFCDNKRIIDYNHPLFLFEIS